ncbi:MAG TPA: hypothetical protein VFZ09_15385 [Archangium sp.]|uniref:hypothetical protein n=1 Tax=Archangium sp. TaxID=1872627 RepID=UPI002E37F7A4|nr:hypothetical protein [Archangium sp.]HEX5747629.1 hypothetical protein [Archangium sp.]
MKVILDPALFLTQVPDRLSADEDAELTRLVADAVRVCRQRGYQVVAAGPYWKRMQQELVRPLERVGGRELKAGLDTLRSLAVPQNLPVAPAGSRKKVWGVKQLFDWPRLGSGWLEQMEQLLIGCALLGGPFILLVRHFEGRNQKTYATGRCELVEKMRWRLYIQVTGQPQCTIPCIRNPRNLLVDWTQRFDESLPAQSDGARFPFCPPEKWWRRHVEPFRTMQSKPAWIDVRDNGWARPATGGGRHWDVYIADPKLAESIGLGQLNIVQWEVRPEGKIGDIHHTPTGKQSRLADTTGWSCD